MAWLTDWFELNGEPMPNKMEIAYDQVNLTAIYKQYEECPVVKHITDKIVTYAQFTALIRNVFPNCKQRPYKAVGGKCFIREQFRNLQRESTLRTDKMLLREFRQMHRNLFIGEKIK